MPVLALAVLAAAELAGCGRRGDLEPPGAAVADEVAPLPEEGISPLDPASEPIDPNAGTLGEITVTPPPPPQNRPFFLDFLL